METPESPPGLPVLWLAHREKTVTFEPGSAGRCAPLLTRSCPSSAKVNHVALDMMPRQELRQNESFDANKATSQTNKASSLRWEWDVGGCLKAAHGYLGINEGTQFGRSLKAATVLPSVVVPAPVKSPPCPSLTSSCHCRSSPEQPDSGHDCDFHFHTPIYSRPF